jgi:predicted Fe-Mo cluster-binding NifX family protein
MKIAVPTREGCVDNHFGHCDHYTIFTIEERKVISREELPSPQGCGCKSGIAAILEQIGVEVMLAGSMGEGAKNTLQAHNIKVIRGCSGDIGALVARYLTRVVPDSGVGCAGHGEEHKCPNH